MHYSLTISGILTPDAAFFSMRWVSRDLYSPDECTRIINYVRAMSHLSMHAFIPERTRCTISRMDDKSVYQVYHVAMPPPYVADAKHTIMAVDGKFVSVDAKTTRTFGPADFP